MTHPAQHKTTHGLDLLLCIVNSPWVPVSLDELLSDVRRRLQAESNDLEFCYEKLSEFGLMDDSESTATLVGTLVECIDALAPDNSDRVETICDIFQRRGLVLPDDPAMPEAFLPELAGQLATFSHVHSRGGIEHSADGGICVYAHGKKAEMLSELLSGEFQESLTAVQDDEELDW